MEARLAGQTDIAGFREESRSLLAHQIPPDEVIWRAEAQNADRFVDANPSGRRAPDAPRAQSSIVPASFQRLCDVVVLHHDAERFALLYRLLWRLVHEPGLRNNPVDADMLHAHQMGQSVRRDMHKIKSMLRFQRVGSGDKSLHVAWFEPAHHVLEAVAPWFAQRASSKPWVIFTPALSVHCDDERLHFGRGIARDNAPATDASDSVWLSIYDNVFGERTTLA